MMEAHEHYCPACWHMWRCYDDLCSHPSRWLCDECMAVLCDIT
jgi:hypothetical protein